MGIGLLFIAIGFVVTEDNAQYLLAGYNTMSHEDKKKVDISKYLKYFREFHIFLGITFLIFSLIFTYLIDKKAGVIFVSIYPILAYIYFVITSAKYSKDLSRKSTKVGVFILVITLIFIIGLLSYKI